MRYNWALSRLPSVCESGMKSDLTHALPCKKGGFVSLGRNNIRNITVSLLTKVCKNVWVEPLLQLLTGESLQQHTAREHEVRPDICVRGFWKAVQAAFFGVSVFNPNAMRCAELGLLKSYKINKKWKKKYCNKRIMRIKHGSLLEM